MVQVITRNAFDADAVQRLLRSPAGGVTKELIRRGMRVDAAAKRLCPVDHGILRASIHMNVISIAGVPAVEVGSDVKYALWVERGTGIYGPRGTPIVPTHGKYLVFQPRKTSGGVFIKRGARNVVFARSVKGRKATPFLAPALLAAR